MTDLFKELGESLRPVKMITVTANVLRKKVQHTFMADTSKETIQDFLINKYGSDCWSWEI